MAVSLEDITPVAELEFDAPLFAMLSEYAEGSTGLDTEAGEYVHALINNRTAFPYCGAGESSDEVHAGGDGGARSVERTVVTAIVMLCVACAAEWGTMASVRNSHQR